MKDDYTPDKQFHLTPLAFLGNMDFLNWYRYFFIIKAVLDFKPKTILEIGEGSGVVRRVLEPPLQKYQTMDVNPKLQPDYLNDVRTPKPELKGEFDCVIAADILEHIPFEDLEKALTNLYGYLNKNGRALITIPHRASNFLWMTPTQIPHTFRIPTGFLSPGAFYRRFIKRKIWIDPDHQWEIGDGHHSVKGVEEIMKKVSFTIEKREALIYVDFWILRKK